MKDIEDMTVAEIIKEYNSLTGDNVKRFENREVAEKQLRKMRTLVKIARTLVADLLSQFESEDIDYGKIKSKPNLKVIKENEPLPEIEPPLPKPSQLDEQKNKKTQATGRYAVSVDGFGVFSSTFQAFIYLRLPMSKHVEFRKRLHRERTLIFEHLGHKYKFTALGRL